MTNLQYYCILGLAEIKKKLCIPETKLFAKDAECAGNKVCTAMGINYAQIRLRFAWIFAQPISF